jgi:hypothetical protein
MTKAMPSDKIRFECFTQVTASPWRHRKQHSSCFISVNQHNVFHIPPNLPKMAPSADQFLLRVTAGPSYDPSAHTLVHVNGPNALPISGDHCTANLKVRIQNYRGPSYNLSWPRLTLTHHRSPSRLPFHIALLLLRSSYP